MNTRKIFRFSILTAAVLVLAAAIGYLALTRIFPMLLAANMEEILARHTGREVSIGRTTVEVLPGASIRLEDVLIGPSETPLLRARKIQADASLWDAFFGGLRISSVILEDARIALDAAVVKQLREQNGLGITPTVVIRGGSVIIPDVIGVPLIESVSGIVSPDRVELSAEVLGGKTEISAKRGNGWEGSVISRGMDLSRFAEGMKGSLATDADFHASGGLAGAKIRFSGKGLVLPWSETEIESFEMTLGARGDESGLTLDEISLVTPVVRVSGSGRIAEPDKKMGSPVTLDLSSDTFDYDTIVSLLPVDDFDPWLKTLLTSQIRGGSSRFTSAHYEGTLEELIHFTRFIDHIMVIQDISGQSFGAGFGPERITDITGRVVYGKGDIVIRDLSGTMNGSSIEKVTLSFPGVILPNMRIGVDVKVDMPARDFLDAWKAAGMPQYALDLFAGISGVKRGRITGDVSTSYDEALQRSFTAKGIVTWKDCDYQWGSQSIRGHSGEASARDFDAPLEISSRLSAGGRLIRSLSVVLEDPFGVQKSSFQATLDGMFFSEKFSLSRGTTVKIKGTGTGPVISATAEISTRRFELLGTSYRLKGRPVQAITNITGKLWPAVSLDFTGNTLQTSPETFTVSGHIEESRGTLRVSGAMNLEELEAVEVSAGGSLSGEVRGEVVIGWGEKTTLTGSLLCRQAAFFMNDSLITVDGPVLMSGDTLKSRSIKITKDATKITVSDGSLILSDRPVFRGDITIEGMTVPFDGIGSAGSFGHYTASGRVRLLDFDFYGILMDEATADASLEDGVLTLSNIRTTGESGTTQGFLSTDLSRILSFDITFALLNANINRFFDAISEEQDWIRGNMDLNGRLYGENGSVNGTLNLVAKNGRLKKYALFSRIFALLNIYKIVQARDIELTSRNFPYNVITSTFYIEDSVMRFDDFFLDSNSLQLSAAGKYSFKSREIDAVLGIQPFETIDRAISWIPLLGWVLTGDNGRLLVVSLKVAGQIDDPSVQIAPIETISAPIRESWSRTLNLPAEIRNEWRKYMPKKK